MLQMLHLVLCSVNYGYALHIVWDRPILVNRWQDIIKLDQIHSSPNSSAGLISL